MEPFCYFSSFLSPKILLLELAQQEFAHHKLSIEPEGLEQGREVQSAGQHVGETKRKHERDKASCILESKGAVRKTISLCMTSREVMHVSGKVNLAFKLSFRIRPLLTVKDDEVVIGKEPSRMS